ncbi:hypothetical protein FRB96_009706 [Tulasnella sp. 330]|nr:hypothetical protein FRB96_009706 [Tulasnella sp. 330]
MEAHDLFLKRGAKWGMAICLKVVGGVCGFKDELDAFTTLANAITIYKDLDAPHGALNKYAKACALYQELGCHEGMASCLAGMAAPQITHKLYASAISFFACRVYAERGEVDSVIPKSKEQSGLCTVWDNKEKMAGSLQKMENIPITYKLYTCVNIINNYVGIDLSFRFVRGLSVLGQHPPRRLDPPSLQPLSQEDRILQPRPLYAIGIAQVETVITIFIGFLRDLSFDCKATFRASK